ncbi:MAG: caspase family protein [Candidatus Heimdallarchaeota archaeon]|nr:caspase family protein [Candidatus Heimdallarchaeota archaeon]
MWLTKRSFRYQRIILVLVIFLIVVNFVPSFSQPTKEVKKYALLLDQFAWNSDNPDLNTCNAIEFKQALNDVGWYDGQFSYLFGNEEITTANLLGEIRTLQKKVDNNDVVLLYFAAHGHGCLRDILDLNSWFHEEFLAIPTEYKILLIDSCHAGEFIEPLENYLMTDSFYAMGSVAPNELAIAFTPDDQVGEWPYSENPFLGIISSHFWSLSLTISSADTNGDSIVSMEELYDHSLPKIKKIYGEVFEEIPEIADIVLDTAGYIDDYPRPLVINNLNENFSLYNSYLQQSIPLLTSLTTPQKIGAIIGSVTGTAIISTTIIMIVKKRR